MDNRTYQSPVVRDWCEAHKVCPEGRDHAAGCFDLFEVYRTLPRPAWVRWMWYEMVGNIQLSDTRNQAAVAAIFDKHGRSTDDVSWIDAAVSDEVRDLLPPLVDWTTGAPLNPAEADDLELKASDPDDCPVERALIAGYTEAVVYENRCLKRVIFWSGACMVLFLFALFIDYRRATGRGVLPR